MIYTLTLNPAYDVHASCAHFEACHENLAEVRSREAGGKGVNISRALCSGGVRNTAVVVLGRENGAEFKRALGDAGMETILLEKEGRIRENLTLHCAGAPETRISFAGFAVDDGILDEVMARLSMDGETVVTFTGRVPSGVSMEKVKAFLNRLRGMGAKIVLDSKSFSLTDMIEVQPWLIKPNQEEISAYFGCEVESIAQAMEGAQAFAAHGVANVMVSLGEQGALLLSGGRRYIARPPVVQAVSTIGAGDSAIAGFLAAALNGADAQERLRMAVAYGTAACLTEGSRPPRREDIARVYGDVRAEEI